jgi:hypothetical protein
VHRYRPRPGQVLWPLTAAVLAAALWLAATPPATWTVAPGSAHTWTGQP